MKQAMVRIHAELQRPELRHAATLVLMIHDELVFEVRQDRVAQVAELVKHEMEGSWPLRVPTPVKLSVGPSWGQLSEVSLEQLRGVNG
jgi:DNA polymerase I-like protein with 3'-5' exonuclease and polymerase domains